MQVEPIDAYLGASRTGAAIGATLYQLDGSTVHAAFSTSGWYEAPAGSGAFHHAGLSLPDAGGVVAVGVSGTEYMRVAVGAAKPLATDYTVARAVKLDNLDAAVATRATPAQVNAEADQALADVGLTSTVTGRIDAAISSRSTITTAQVNAEVDTALADVGMTTIVTGRIDTTISSRGTSTLTTSDIDARLVAYDAPTKTELDSAIDSLPTAAEIWAYGQRTLTGTMNNVTVVSAVSGGVVTVFARDTWRFTIVSSALDLAPYEVVALVVKRSGQPDSEALLYVRSDSGLVRIGGAAATAGDGSLVIDSATQISVKVAIGVTGVEASDYYTWWLKGFDSTPVVDEGYTVATGAFRVLVPGLQATA